jgi:hypothetical protein
VIAHGCSTPYHNNDEPVHGGQGEREHGHAQTDSFDEC